jgi:hypothetical protein
VLLSTAEMIMFTTIGFSNRLMKHGRIVAPAASMVGALLLVACGGSGDDDPGPDTASATQCTVDSVRAAVGRLAPVEGNVTIEAVEARTGGSFTPAGAAQPIVDLPDFCRVVALAQPTTDS